MGATNYFRVAEEVIPFVDTSPEETAVAFDRAAREQRRRAKGGRAPRILLYRTPPIPGPWSAFMLIGGAP